MTRGGFGRKPAAVPAAPQDDLEAKRAAFIAAERARRERESGDRPLPARPAAAIPNGPFFVRDKSLGLAYLLWFFLGGLSVHRFYLGYTTSGAIQLFLRLGGLAAWHGSAAAGSPGTALAGLLMLGAGGLWLLIDVFLIPGMCRRGSQGRIGPAYGFAAA